MSDWAFLNRHRVKSGYYGSTPDYGFNGAFMFPLPGEARRIYCIASDQQGWQHVSVSFGEIKAVPSWSVMTQVKDLFWEPEDVVIQIHPPRSQYVNVHPGCLHLWRCIDGREQPLPPRIFV